MTKVAFIPLPPLGDSILLMGQLEELKRLYSPCEITIFAISLVAELYGNYAHCDRVVELGGGLHGRVALPDGYDEQFDIVFNHGYEPWYTEIVRKLKKADGKAFGMEEICRSAAECSEVFDKWVSLDYWNKVTKARWKLVPNQMAELIRLVSPGFAGDPACLSENNYCCVRPEGAPEAEYALFLPGTSASFKTYPMIKVKALAMTLQQLGVRSIFALGPQDDEIKALLNEWGVEYFSDLPLAELAWLVRHARVVIGNDSGPMHLAASFDVPTIHFFSFSGADNWFCYSQGKHRLLMPECGRRDGLSCGNCTFSCIGKVAVSVAVREVCDLLGKNPPKVFRIAYFAEDLIGDALVWANQIEALVTRFAPCEITVFCPGGLVELFECMAFCDHVVAYDPRTPWSEEEAKSFGRFDVVLNTRYDADSVVRVAALAHSSAYGFENVDIPEAVCKQIFTNYVPLSRWDDFHLRRETSVTEQGSELIRLFQPDYHCDFVSFDKTSFVREIPGCADVPRVVFVLGASYSAKSWGLDNYLELARFIHERGFHPLFLLGPKEKAFESRIRDEGFDAKLNLSFKRIVGYFDKDFGTACVVGNDTGLMHLACALGAPSVTIVPFGEQFTWFPYANDPRAPHHCIAPNCSAPMCLNSCRNVSRCIGGISIDEVKDVVSKVSTTYLPTQRDEPQAQANEMCDLPNQFHLTPSVGHATGVAMASCRHQPEGPQAGIQKG